MGIEKAENGIRSEGVERPRQGATLDEASQEANKVKEFAFKDEPSNTVNKEEANAVHQPWWSTKGAEDPLDVLVQKAGERRLEIEKDSDRAEVAGGGIGGNS